MLVKAEADLIDAEDKTYVVEQEMKRVQYKEAQKHIAFVTRNYTLCRTKEILARDYVAVAKEDVARKLKEYVAAKEHVDR